MQERGPWNETVRKPPAERVFAEGWDAYASPTGDPGLTLYFFTRLGVHQAKSPSLEVNFICHKLHLEWTGGGSSVLISLCQREGQLSDTLAVEQLMQQRPGLRSQLHL
jgi:hypothetical protein